MTPGTDDGQREAIESALDETCAALADDELRVVAYLAARLFEGQQRYGRLDLAHDARDWAKERAEEIGDLLVYSSFAALKATLGRAPAVTDEEASGYATRSGTEGSRMVDAVSRPILRPEPRMTRRPASGGGR